MRAVLVIVASLVITPNVIFAQSQESRGSAAAIAGAGKTWDDEGQIGSGLAAGGRVDWRLFGNTRAEVAFDFLQHDRSGGFFQANGHTLLTSASLVQRFGSGTAQPYVLGGLTLAHHSGTTTFDSISRSHTSTDMGYSFGGGLAVRVGQRFEIGPEARFYIINAGNDSDPAWANWVGVRVGARF